MLRCIRSKQNSQGAPRSKGERAHCSAPPSPLCMAASPRSEQQSSLCCALLGSSRLRPTSKRKKKSVLCSPALLCKIRGSAAVEQGQDPLVFFRRLPWPNSSSMAKAATATRITAPRHRSSIGMEAHSPLPYERTEVRSSAQNAPKVPLITH